MTREYIFIILIIGVTALSIFIFISKKSIRIAFFAAAVTQEITWPTGLIMTLLEKIEYPVRIFPDAINSSFLHGFILNPIVYAIYYVHYPKQAKLIWKSVYTLCITLIPLSMEIIENKYTKLIHYKSWSAWYSWMILLLSYFLIRKYLDWFFKSVKKQGATENEV